jgi:hypothetical protein
LLKNGFTGILPGATVLIEFPKTSGLQLRSEKDEKDSFNDNYVFFLSAGSHWGSLAITTCLYQVNNNSVKHDDDQNFRE